MSLPILLGFLLAIAAVIAALAWAGRGAEAPPEPAAPLPTEKHKQDPLESLAIEGPQMSDAYGRIVPETPENISKKEKDLAAIAKQAEKDRAAAEKAERKRLAACERRGIEADDCPRPAPATATVTVGTSDTATSG